MDRLASELQLSPLEAWHHLQRLVENVNALTATLVRRRFQDTFENRFYFFVLVFVTPITFLLRVLDPLLSSCLSFAWMSVTTVVGRPASDTYLAC